MLTRREMVLGTAAAVALPTLAACGSKANYEEAARLTWRHGDTPMDDRAATLRELVRYATLAPSSHNTQCWRFHIEPKAITITPDFSRRCAAVDPDNHHLFVSLGCATENLVHAALANGFHADANVAVTAVTDGDRITLNLEPTTQRASPQFQAIVDRQSTRGDYDGRSLTADELTSLEKAGSGSGVRVKLMTDRQAMETVLEYVVSGNSAQMNDRAFVSELKSWIRFSKGEAVASGDGLFSGATGNPSVPSWIGRPMMNLFFTEKSENDKYARQLRNSAGIAVFASEVNDKSHWIEVGRCYERFALQATALGIRNALLNQPVEVGTLRPQFATWLGIGTLRPDLVVRFGRGAKLPQSLRRPVAAVLV